MIREWIGLHINRIRIVEATQCDVPLEILLSVGRFQVANVDAQRERADGGTGEAHYGHDGNDRLFETWSYESDRPFSLESLREMVRKELPASI